MPAAAHTGEPTEQVKVAFGTDGRASIERIERTRFSVMVTHGNDADRAIRAQRECRRPVGWADRVGSLKHGHYRYEDLIAGLTGDPLRRPSVC